MKVVLWPPDYLPMVGGCQRLVHCLAMQLQQNGHDVLVIANDSTTDEFQETFIDGMKVFRFPLIRALRDYNFSTIKKIIEKINHIIDDFVPDIINIHGLIETFCFYQTRVLKKGDVPVCVTIHGLIEAMQCRKTESSKLCKMASVISTVSKAFLESLVQQYGFYHPSIRVIYNGLPIPSSPVQPLPVFPVKLAMVGRLVEEKCFDVAFQALKLLIKKYPQLKLILFGEGELRNELGRLKQFLELDQSIEMRGSVSQQQVYDSIDQASIVVIPSRYESFSLVALEAAFRARPVIASDVYGLREVVEQGATGLLVDPQDPNKLAAAIDQLLSNPEKMEEMGRNAYLRATRLFNIEIAARDYTVMYQYAMEKKHEQASCQRCHSSP